MSSRRNRLLNIKGSWRRTTLAATLERMRMRGTEVMPHNLRACPGSMACVVLALTVLIPTAAWAQQSISLDDAIERAVIRSPQMASQQQQVDNAYLTQKTSWGRFLPTLSASGSGSLRSSSTFNDVTGLLEPGSSDSYGAGLVAVGRYWRGHGVSGSMMQRRRTFVRRKQGMWTLAIR